MSRLNISAILLEMSIAEIWLPERTANMLQVAGIETVEDVLHTSREVLLNIRWCGPGCLHHVYGSLALLSPELRHPDCTSEDVAAAARRRKTHECELAEIKLRAKALRRPGFDEPDD
jgi:hypothetical protein